MQRRKFPQPIQKRPKLVLQRQQTTLSQNASIKLGRTMSIFKIPILNKENEQTEHISPKRFSLQSIHKGNHEKSREMKQQNTAFIKEQNMSKSKKIMSIVDLEDNHYDKKTKIEDLANKIIKIVKYNKGSKDIAAENQLQQTKLKEVLTIILEATSNTKQLITDLNLKMNALTKEKQQQHQMKSNHFTHQKRTPVLKIQQCINYYFSCNFENYSKMHDSVLTKEEQSRIVNSHTLALHSSVYSQMVWEEARKLKEEFVFQHMGQINDYILNQPNKILHEASRRHKYLEEQLFAYADFLSISHLGAKTYTPMVNIKHMQSEIERSMRTLNKELIQGDYSFQEKSRKLRDYVFLIRQSYSAILQELMTVIDSKTEQAKSFLFKVMKWEENYITRKEYLGNLKKEYCESLFSIVNDLIKLKEQAGDKESKGTIKSLQESISKIDRIYLLGNSFY